MRADYKKYECHRRTIMKRENVLDERFPRHCPAVYFNVEELRKSVRAKLLGPIRFLRTADFEYVNPEEKNLADLHLVNDVEKNYAFLYAAFIADDTELLQKLHQRGADVNFIYPDENLNALHLSALHGSFECTQWLLEKGCPVIETYHGLSPLHFAVLANSPPIYRLLIERAWCKADSRALHMAVWSNIVDCVEYLLEFRAPVNEYDQFGNTALHIATDVDNVKIVELLLRDDRIHVGAKTLLKKYTALHLAAENGYQSCLLALLDGGANVHELCAKKQTPLHLACKESSLECVRSLLKRGADVNARDYEKKTPLHAAVSKSANPAQINVVRYLVEWNADVHLADYFGFTALHVAALNALEECVEELILDGASVAARTNGEVTALSIMNRKTPNSWSKVGERLDLSLAYSQRQLLKFSFRDIKQNSRVGEIDYLYTLQKEGNVTLLEHPICRAFLHLKWQKVRIFILFRLVVSFVTVLLTSLLISWGVAAPACYHELVIAMLGLPQEESFYTQEECSLTTWNAMTPLISHHVNCSRSDCEDIAQSTLFPGSPTSENSTRWFVALSCTIVNVSSLQKPQNNSIACHTNDGILDGFFNAHRFLPGSFLIFIMVMLAVNSVRLIFTFASYTSTTRFLVNYGNILEIMVTVCVPLTLFNMYLKEFEVVDQEVRSESFGGITLLASWSYLMVIAAQLPTIGTYMTMFRKVLKEFVKMILAFSCLLMGYAFTFCALRADYFHNSIVGSIRIMAMMTGELNSNDLLNKKWISLEGYTTPFVLLVFTIFITVVLMNLLVGIAVNDVEGLRKNADLFELVEQTRMIKFFEKTCFSGLFPPFVKTVLRRFLYIWSDKYIGVVMYVEPLSANETRLPRDVINAGLEIALNRLKKKELEEVCEQPKIEDRLHSLEEQIVKLQELVRTSRGEA